MGEKSKSGLIIAGILAMGIGAGAVYFLTRKKPTVSSTHKDCVNNQCVSVPGPGQDLCQSDNDCIIPPVTHLDCQNGNCVEVLGGDSDTCTLNSDCRHNICQAGNCVEVMTPGTDTCISNADCVIACNPAICRQTNTCCDGSSVITRDCVGGSCTDTGNLCFEDRYNVNPRFIQKSVDGSGNLDVTANVEVFSGTPNGNTLIAVDWSDGNVDDIPVILDATGYTTINPTHSFHPNFWTVFPDTDVNVVAYDQNGCRYGESFNVPFN